MKNVDFKGIIDTITEQIDSSEYCIVQYQNQIDKILTSFNEHGFVPGNEEINSEETLVTALDYIQVHIEIIKEDIQNAKLAIQVLNDYTTSQMKKPAKSRKKNA